MRPRLLFCSHSIFCLRLRSNLCFDPDSVLKIWNFILSNIRGISRETSSSCLEIWLQMARLCCLNIPEIFFQEGDSFHMFSLFCLKWSQRNSPKFSWFAVLCCPSHDITHMDHRSRDFSILCNAFMSDESFMVRDFREFYIEYLIYFLTPLFDFMLKLLSYHIVHNVWFSITLRNQNAPFS